MSDPAVPPHPPAADPRRPSPPTDARSAGRAPWQLRLAGWLWAASGAIFALGPAAAVLLLIAQYRSLRRQGMVLADLTDLVDSEDRLRVAELLDAFTGAESAALTASAWALTALAIVYAIGAALSFAAYAVLARRTALGDQWARVTATVLAAVCTPIILVVWQFFAAFAWVPLDALWANHLGLVLIAAHTTAVTLSWLPAANAYVARRSAERRTRAAARISAAPPPRNAGMA